MKGFLGTAAAMVFIFSLVTAMYSFTLVQTDLGDSARVGLAVESTRWAVEADNFQCNNPIYDGTVYEDATKAGIAVGGDASDLTYLTRFAALTIHLERAYAPGANLLAVDPFTVTGCDPNGDPVSLDSYEYWDGGAWVDIADPTSLPAGTRLRARVTDGTNIGYSNEIVT